MDNAVSIVLSAITVLSSLGTNSLRHLGCYKQPYGAAVALVTSFPLSLSLQPPVFVCYDIYLGGFPLYLLMCFGLRPVDDSYYDQISVLVTLFASPIPSLIHCVSRYQQFFHICISIVRFIVSYVYD